MFFNLVINIEFSRAFVHRLEAEILRVQSGAGVYILSTIMALAAVLTLTCNQNSHNFVSTDTSGKYFW